MNVIKQFEEYTTNLPDKGNLIIYFSKHDKENKAVNEDYWIPIEAKKGVAQQYIPNNLILTILSSIQNTPHFFNFRFLF